MLADSIDRCEQSAHCLNTALWIKRIAKYMRLSEEDTDDMTLAVRLHDIGKVVVPGELITKPVPLNEQEWAVIKRHAEFSAALMEPYKCLKSIIPLDRLHHENFNGKGYPTRFPERTYLWCTHPICGGCFFYDDDR